MVLRRSAYQELKRRGFKPLLMGRQGAILTSGEDTELGYALALVGYRIWYDSRLKLVHFMPANRLTRAYHWKLVRGCQQGGLSLACYEIALRGEDIGAVKFYLWRIVLLGSWLGRAALKFLLLRISWPTLRIDFSDWVQSLFDYGALRRVLRDDLPRVIQLKQSRPASE